MLKRGAEGATFFGSDGARVDAPAFLVEEVDPTGAGDCFGGAYVACRRLGMEPDAALTYACAAGARNVTGRGPMEGAGTRAELDRIHRGNGKRVMRVTLETLARLRAERYAAGRSPRSARPIRSSCAPRCAMGARPARRC